MKKQIPLALLQSLKSIIDESQGIIYVSKNASYLAIFHDSDPASDFFFQIESYHLENNGKTVYPIAFKPGNSENLELASISARL